jgi:membrane protein implicated in regulation of membrane protease activity
VVQADLAQLVAHRTCNAGVRGSSPLVGPICWSKSKLLSKPPAPLSVNPHRLENMAMWIWFAASGVLLLIELITADLLFASLAISALAAAGAAGLGADVVTQGIVFGVAAAVSLVLLRPIALKHMRKQSPNSATNTDALLGAEAFTLTEVTERSGQVKLSG